MSEIKKELVKLREGQKYTAEEGDVLIKDAHSIADVVRYLISICNGDTTDIQYCLDEESLSQD